MEEDFHSLHELQASRRYACIVTLPRNTGRPEIQRALGLTHAAYVPYPEWKEKDTTVIIGVQNGLLYHQREYAGPVSILLQHMAESDLEAFVALEVIDNNASDTLAEIYLEEAIASLREAEMSIRPSLREEFRRSVVEGITFARKDPDKTYADGSYQ